MTDVDASKDAVVVVDLIRSEMVNPTDFQPYFVAYALAHSCTPDEMHKRIVTRVKGAAMLDFMVWMREMWRTWVASSPKNKSYVGEKRHAAFQAWLPDHVAALVRGRERTADLAALPPARAS